MCVYILSSFTISVGGTQRGDGENKAYIRTQYEISKSSLPVQKKIYFFLSVIFKRTQYYKSPFYVV